MRFATYEHRDQRHVAVVDEHGTLRTLSGVHSLTGLLTEAGSVPELLDAGARTLDAQAGPHVSEVRLLPPLQPPTVRDFVTFEEHVEGVRRSVDGAAGVPGAWYAAPTFYFTNPYALFGPHDDIPVPPGIERARLRAGGRRRHRHARAATSPPSRPATTSSATRSSTTGRPVTCSPPR